jgi:hypothetical protein
MYPVLDLRTFFNRNEVNAKEFKFYRLVTQIAK